MCRTTVGTLILDSTLALDSGMELAGDLECPHTLECPYTQNGSFFDLEAQELCPGFYDDGTVCATSVRVSCDLFDTHAHLEVVSVPSTKYSIPCILQPRTNLQDACLAELS